MRSQSLPNGKLPVQLMRELLGKLSIEDTTVKVGPSPGEDAAVIDRGSDYLILAADPITFSPKRIGWYSVQVNANDIAAMGGTPQFFLSTILLPSGEANEETVNQIITEIAQACRELGCLAVGGHTEVTSAVSVPVVSGAMVGVVSKDKLLTSAGAKPGDMVVLTKGIAIEATAILAQEQSQKIRKSLGDEVWEKALKFLDNPGLSVLPESQAAVNAGNVTAMHDVTEGGIATALWELAEASNVGLVVMESEIPRFWEAIKIAELFKMNLLGALGSGAMLITIPESSTSHLLATLKETGNEGYVIGRVVQHDQGIHIIRGSEQVPLPRFEKDEVLRVLDQS